MRSTVLAMLTATLLAASTAHASLTGNPAATDDGTAPHVEQLAFPYISICSGSYVEYFNLGGVGGGGGFVSHTVHVIFPSIVGCSV